MNWGQVFDGTSDEALMAMVGEGNHAAFTALVDRHLGRAVAVAQRVTGNHGDAQEIAQEAFLRVWTRAPQWRDTGARFTTWLYRVVVNLSIDRVRRPTMAALDSVPEPHEPKADALGLLEQGERTRIVGAAIAALPHRQRAALALCHYQGLSMVEAAEVLATSATAVESLLVRARRTLRKRLAGARHDLLGEVS